jgi:hypothetical protein
MKKDKKVLANNQLRPFFDVLNMGYSPHTFPYVGDIIH